MGSPCKRGHGGKVEDCDPVNDEDPQAINNNTIKILLTRSANYKVVAKVVSPRHPFDRLIIEFRRSKGNAKKGKRTKRSSNEHQPPQDETHTILKGGLWVGGEGRLHAIGMFGKVHEGVEHVANYSGSWGLSNRMEFIDRVIWAKCGTSDVLFIRFLVRQFIKSKVLDVEQSVVRPVSEVTRVSQLQTKQALKVHWLHF